MTDKHKEQNRLRQKTFKARREAEGKRSYRYWLTRPAKKAVDDYIKLEITNKPDPT